MKNSPPATCESHATRITRRDLVQRIYAAGAAALIGSPSFAGADENPGASSSPDRRKVFPDRFLWGCATTGYQTEGNNVNSDIWLLEHLPGNAFKEPSGDACDHYHHYPQDIRLLADLGFNTYRFSIEWSRIEPEKGFFSRAALDHYRRMLVACRELGLTTFLTYCHFTLPRWFAFEGGWENPAAADLYARFCEKATRHFGDLIDYATTFNEPNVPQLLNWLEPLGKPGTTLADVMRESLIKTREQLEAPQFAGFFMGDPEKMRENLMASHHKAREAIKSVRPVLPVGFTLAIFDDQPAAHDSHLEEKRADVYAPWLEAAKRCDYLGVQTYSRVFVGKKDLPPPKGVELTQVGWEYYPECVGHVVRYAGKEAGVPLIVTENGLATADDTRRVEYFQRALTGLKRAMDDGIDVRGYIAWSLLDNFEWWLGYEPKFGIVAVDRATQKRTIKPSAVILGDIARRNSL